MANNKNKENYNINEVFIDNYEYEAYFSIAANIDISKITPQELDVKIELSSRKKVRLFYPDDKTVLVVVPISTKNNNPKKKAELRIKYLVKFQSTIPEIRLSLRDQLAIRKRLLVNTKDKDLIDKQVKKSRQAGTRKLKRKLNT